MPPAPEPPLFTITGLGARPIREWFQHLGPPMVWLAYFSTKQRRFTVSEIMDWILIGIVFAGVVHFVLKISRGRIELHPDRLRIRSWNDDKFLALNAVIPLTSVTKVLASGSVLRIGYNDSRGALHYKRIALIAPVAEELFDQLQERMEQLPELDGRIVHNGSHRLSVARAPNP